MEGLRERIDAAVAVVRPRVAETPVAGIILGTGLGSFADVVDISAEIPYTEIPGFVVSTVAGHAGRLVVGRVAGRPIVGMEGRFHLYEGYDTGQVTFPVRVMKALGADVLIVSNACGGMNPDLHKGDILLIDDHINLRAANPLVGTNDDELGPRFPDMSRPYDPDLMASAESICREEGIRHMRGVYVGVVGPNLETRAEYRFLRTVGADVVGMSTVPEVIVAVHAGMRVLGLSVVTDMCLPDELEPAKIEDIIAAAQSAEPKLAKIVTGVVKGL